VEQKEKGENNFFKPRKADVEKKPQQTWGANRRKRQRLKGAKEEEKTKGRSIKKGQALPIKYRAIRPSNGRNSLFRKGKGLLLGRKSTQIRKRGS